MNRAKLYQLISIFGPFALLGITLFVSFLVGLLTPKPHPHKRLIAHALHPTGNNDDD